MDPQIHAAIVGGALGGFTLAGGVILDLRLRARQERRRELEAVVEDVARTNQQLSQVAIVGQFDIDAFSRAHLAIGQLTGRAIRLADAAGRRHRDELRAAAADLSDMWMAVLMRAGKQAAAGQPVGEAKACRPCRLDACPSHAARGLRPEAR